MDFHIYTTLREACKKSGVEEDPAAFYRLAFNDAFQMGSGQFSGQLQNENGMRKNRDRDEQAWEQAHRPYYNVWPSIVAMLTRLIDIMEKPWRDDRVQHALHWDGYGREHKSEGKVANVPGVMEGWHTFALLWKADEYVFYVDGNETWRTTAGGVCQVPLYIKLSDEIGDWAGDIKKADRSPQTTRSPQARQRPLPPDDN